MKLNEFNKKLKKEFNENYNSDDSLVVKSKRKRMAIRLIPVYALALGCMVLGIVFGIRYGISNPVSYEKQDIVQDENYRELSYISSSDLKGYIGYGKATEISATIPVQTETTTAAPGSKDGATSYETNNQEEGVIEADIAKFDGTYCYYLYQGYLYIYDLSGNQLVNKVVFTKGAHIYEKMQIYNNRVIIYNYNDLYIYTFDGELKEEIHKYYHLVESRIIDNTLYVIARQFIDVYNDEIASDKIYYDKLTSVSFIYSLEKINLDTLEEKEVEFASGYDGIIYMNQNYMVLSNQAYSKSLCKTVTLNSVFNIDLEPIGVFVVEGTILDQYSIDVHQDTLRVVSTLNDSSIEGYVRNELTIFDLKELSTLSCLKEGIGLVGERVKSVTFKDLYCFIVTFRTTDPLYEIDLTDPKNPIIVDALHVEGYSSYLKAFMINDTEYLFGAGYISNQIKYSIYLNDKENTQVGSDYLLLDGEQINFRYYNGSNWVYSGICDYAVNPHAMFFYLDNEYFYIGAPMNGTLYKIFIVDVNSSTVIEEYKSIETEGETRLFLYQGKVYLPQKDKLIIEDF